MSGTQFNDKEIYRCEQEAQVAFHNMEAVESPLLGSQFAAYAAAYYARALYLRQRAQENHAAQQKRATNDAHSLSTSPRDVASDH